jgi:hypothetical protein
MGEGFERETKGDGALFLRGRVAYTTDNPQRGREKGGRPQAPLPPLVIYLSGSCILEKETDTTMCKHIFPLTFLLTSADGVL